MPNKCVIGVLLGFLQCLPLSMVWACGERDPLYPEAVKLFQQNQYQNAAAQFQMLVNQHPSCPNLKLDLAVVYFKSANLDQAEPLLVDLLSDSHIPAPLRQQAVKMWELTQDQQSQQFENVHKAKPVPHWQLAVGVGQSDNVNNGVSFDQFTFGSGLTLPLAEQSKAQSGQWQDLEVGYHEALNDNTQVHVNAAWRDHFSNDGLDLGVVRTVLETKPRHWKKLEPRVVVSGGGIFLGSQYYRQDLAIGGQIQPQVGKRKLALGYQFADSNYRRLEDTDSQAHRVSVSVPLSNDKAKVNWAVDAGYQWPANAERLADYQETSVRVRAGVMPKSNQLLSASYGITQQRDANPYNTLLFGDEKRNLDQKVFDIGWSKQAGRNYFYEAKVQSRRQTSKLILFENSAVDVTLGVRWQLD